MSSLTENITQAISDFRGIKEALIDKGMAVPSGTPTSDYADLILKCKSYPIYGVSGLFDSSPALTRTDDAASMGYAFSWNGTFYALASDFDEVFPYSEITLSTDEFGNEWVNFPKMFFRVGADSSNRLTDIAVSKTPSGDGDWYKVMPFSVGRYYGSSTKNSTAYPIKTQSGKNGFGGFNRSTLRKKAAVDSSDFHIIDLYHETVLMFLWYIEFATKNSYSVMRGHCQSSMTQAGYRIPTGGTDAITTPSGYIGSTDQMRYHYIEDFVGNCTTMVDGFIAAAEGDHDYVTADAAKFSDTVGDGYTPVPWTVPAPNCLAALGWDKNNPFLCTPHSTVSDSNYATYFCDKAGNDDSNGVCAIYGYFAFEGQKESGLNQIYYYGRDSGNMSCCPRLMKLA